MWNIEQNRIEIELQLIAFNTMVEKKVFNRNKLKIARLASHLNYQNFFKKEHMQYNELVN